MKKLEKSIRHALTFYGPRLRAGGWYLPLGSVGDPPKAGYFRSAYADVEDGVVTGIAIYVQSEAIARRHYYNWDGTVDVSEAVEQYIKDSDFGWDALVSSISELIRGKEEA